MAYVSEDFIKELSEGKVTLLRAGDYIEDEGGIYAPASCVLIQGEYTLPNRDQIFTNILVDAMGFGEEETTLGYFKAPMPGLRPLLKAQGLDAEDIDLILLTHNHPDHIGAMGICKRALVRGPDSTYRILRPNYYEKSSSERFGELIGEEIDLGNELRVINTPGHTLDSVSVVFGKENPIAIVGDLVWTKDDWDNDSLFHSLCANDIMQSFSRNHLAHMKPHIIIPGHDRPFTGEFVPERHTSIKD